MLVLEPSVIFIAKTLNMVFWSTLYKLQIKKSKLIIAWETNITILKYFFSLTHCLWSKPKICIWIAKYVSTTRFVHLVYIPICIFKIHFKPRASNNGDFTFMNFTPHLFNGANKLLKITTALNWFPKWHCKFWIPMCNNFCVESRHIFIAVAEFLKAVIIWTLFQLLSVSSLFSENLFGFQDKQCAND